MSSVDYLPELAAALDRLVPVEEGVVGDWEDVMARVERRPSRVRRLHRPRRLTRLVIFLVAVALLLAGIATAAYLILGRPGRLTVIGGRGPVAGVVGLDSRGRLQTLWRCPHGRFCGGLVSAAWAPDGHRLAISVATFAATSLYDGVHIIDVSTGADRQLPSPPRPSPSTSAGSMQAAVQLIREEQRIFGCVTPRSLAWSPDGRRLAYVCDWFPTGAQRARIYTIRPDGTGRRLLHTRATAAYWPSWSRDGTQIVFSTGMVPSQSGIYTVNLDGSHKQFIARGTAPDWSPDGRAIAYSAPSCGPGLNAESGLGYVRLVTPRGRDITPARDRHACKEFGPYLSPVPGWSPDGRQLAISATSAFYLVNRDGSDFRQIDLQPGGGVSGRDRPAWQPESQGGSK